MSDMTLYSICGGCSATRVEPQQGAGEIGRRTFLAQSALLAAAAALSACGIGVDTTAPNIPAGTTLKVSDYAALSATNGVALVTLSGAQLAVVRLGATSFVVLSRVCPHQGGIVNQNGSSFLCPNHGAQFTLSGQWEGGQPTGSLHSYSTTFDATTGILTIS
jgi:cytochrome b6-f complex iron-sulfur subunit